MRIHRVRLGADEYRVIRPDRPARGLFLRPAWAADLYADDEGAAQLAVAWGLAARSPRSLVYLPIRGNAAPDGLPVEPDEPVAPLDLALVHHRSQFPASRWKAVRARLGAGVPHTVTIPESDFQGPGAELHPRYWTEEFRDRLSFARAAETMFVTGSAVAFRETGATVHRLTAPRYADPGGGGESHRCVELDAGSRHRRGARGDIPDLLHIQYCGDWRATA